MSNRGEGIILKIIDIVIESNLDDDKRKEIINLIEPFPK